MWFFLLWRHGRPRMTNDQQLIILVTQCTIVLIRKNIGSIKFVSGEAAEHNCPNTEEYRVNKIHIGRCSRARYEFYWPDIFCIGTIVNCVTNLSWFCNQTSYLMFSILGQRIYHDFESIQPCILSFSYPWDMEFIMVVSSYFTSNSIFLNMYMYETKWYNVNREHNLIAVLHHEVSH